MNKMLLSVKGIAFMSVFPILFLGLTFLNQPQHKQVQKNEVMHTYLLTIPGSAGVCPYQLMQSSNGMMQMIHQNACSQCPFEHGYNSSFSNTVYMTANCPDVNSVKALLPASIQNVVKIKLLNMPGTLSKMPRLFTSVTR